MKKAFTLCLLTSALMLPMTGHAQFGSFLQQLSSGMKTDPAAANADTAGLPTGQSSLLSTYISANKDVLYANALMAESLGLKEQAAIAKATADALTEGATKDSLEETNKVVNSSSAALEEALQKSPKLSQKSQELYGRGLARLGLGMIKYSSLKQQTASMATGGVSSMFSGLSNAQSNFYIISTLPKTFINLASTLKTATSFASSNNIKVPDDATKAMAGL